MGKQFWTLDRDGNEVSRDLEKENVNFTNEAYYRGEFDGYNYMWHEMFNNYVYDDNGCDYERYGCFIKEGDVVLDIGANIGVFAHRAEFRGASKVISFEPITPTFNCLIKNKGPKTTVYKMAVGGSNQWVDFKIPVDYRHIGGGTSQDDAIAGREVIHQEKAYMVNVNDFFSGIGEKIDFMKVDIEGGEVDLLNTIKDEYLLSLRCLSCEFHKTNEEFEAFQSDFVNRMNSLGFRSFVLFLGDGRLRTVTFWKE